MESAAIFFSLGTLMMQCKLTAFLIAVFKVLDSRPHLNFEGKKLERDQGGTHVCVVNINSIRLIDTELKEQTRDSEAFAALRLCYDSYLRLQY